MVLRCIGFVLLALLDGPYHECSKCIKQKHLIMTFHGLRNAVSRGPIIAMVHRAGDQLLKSDILVIVT